MRTRRFEPNHEVMGNVWNVIEGRQNDADEDDDDHDDDITLAFW
jgi:hypothetical protein